MFKRILIYYTSAFLQGITFIIIPTAAPFIKSMEGNAITDFQYGLFTIPMIIIAIICTVFLKQIISFLGQHRVYYLSIVTNILFLILGLTSYLTQGDNVASFVLFMSAYLCFGIAFGLLISVLNILTIALKPEKADSLLVGLHLCLSLGASVSPFIVSFAQELGAWQIASAIMITAFTLLTLSSLPLIPKGNTTQKQKEISHEKRSLPLVAWCILGTIILYALVETVIVFWTSDYLITEKKATINDGTLAISIFWGMVAVGRLFSSLATLKINGWYLYLLSPIISFIALSLLIPAPDINTSLIYIAILGFGCSYFFPLSISLVVRTFPQWQEKTSGLSVTALFLGIGLCNVLIGFLKKSGVTLEEAFSGVRIITLLIFLTSIILFLAVRKK